MKIQDIKLWTEHNNQNTGQPSPQKDNSCEDSSPPPMFYYTTESSSNILAEGAALLGEELGAVGNRGPEAPQQGPAQSAPELEHAPLQWGLHLASGHTSNSSCLPCKL